MGYTAIDNGYRSCIMCVTNKPVHEFYAYAYKTKQGKPSMRYESRCKDCSRARRKEYYANNTVRSLSAARRYKRLNRDVLAQRRAAYRLANREATLASRRASQARRKAHQPGGATGADYERVLAEARFGDRYLDVYSGELIDQPTVDHIEPLCKGGAHDYWNMSVTSLANNSQKHARSLLIWLRLR